jgi:hypothetical protein
MATVIDTDTLITAIRETTAKHGIELVSFWATTIAAVVSAAALFVIFMQMKAGDRQLSLLAEQIRATVQPAATALTRQLARGFLLKS